MTFSAHYWQALKEAEAHHARSKTYSGRFLRPHVPFIAELIKQRGCQSVLDYGCGKGQQYSWVSHGGEASIPAGETIESFWGIQVQKFDPAWPPYSAAPKPAHLVICTHVLGSIPLDDLSEFLDHVMGLSLRVLYIAERCGEVGKQVFSNRQRFPRGWSHEQWVRLLRTRPHHPDLDVWLATTERDLAGGKRLRRERVVRC